MGRFALGDFRMETAHRPWPLPRGPWVMAQRWHDLLFAHWPISTEALRPLLPDSLRIDTFEGQAWIGVIPFRMSGVRPRLVPPAPRLSAFPELNVRTYVVAEDKPGIWFFGLEAGNPLAVAIARGWFHLPYFHGEMSLREEAGWIRYKSHRIHKGAPPAEFLGRYRPAGAVELAAPGTLARWLTERYCLYTLDGAGRLQRGEIHHVQWPLQPAEAEIAVNTMTQPHGIALPEAPPLLHFARFIEAVVWPLRRVMSEK
jgi:uncharacterized protein YqjF (DUF2071 family)